MTTAFATTEELTARLSDTYTAPADPTRIIVRASELIDYVTRGRAQAAWDEDDDLDNVALMATKAAITKATCDQVEFWLEVGEEHDVAGLRGSLQGGRVQIQRLPGDLGQRARRTLAAAGLLYAGAASW